MEGTLYHRKYIFLINESLESLKKAKIVHNDVKPQNFVVKYLVGSYDLMNIRIALTDCGSAGSKNKGGTPIFASPECFAETNFQSDIFSLGRLFLYIILSKEQFLAQASKSQKTFAKNYLNLHEIVHDRTVRLLSYSNPV